MITELRELAQHLPGRLFTDTNTQGGPASEKRLSEQPARIRRQRTLAVQITGWALIALYVIALAVSHLPGTADIHDHQRCLLMLAGIAVTALGLWLANRDKSMEGMWVICFGILAIFGALQIIAQVGIRSTATYILLLLVPLSGFVGGKRNMQPVFAGVVASVVLTYIAEKAGWIDGQSGSNLSLLEATLISQLLVCGGLYLLARVIDDSLDLLSNLPHESNRIISHELRQPLSTVVAAVQVLSHPHLSDNMKARTLKNLSNATNSMMALLDDIADHGKLASGETEIVSMPFSPAAVTQEVFGMYESAAMQKGISPRCRIDIEEKTVLMGDASRITQVLSNLLNNAVKFTEHGEVTLAVQGRQPVDGETSMRLRFTIMDTGVGIAKDKQRQIFTAFTKSDDERFNQPGMGLGLSIAKHLVEAMQGTIGFESTRGRGSLFWVEVHLPLVGSGSVNNTGVANLTVNAATSQSNTNILRSDSVIPLPLNKPRTSM